MHGLWRRFGPILPGLLVLAGLLALRLADPTPVAALRLQGFDLFQRLAPPAYDPGVPVRVIAIDDESLRRVGQWPWPRDRLARLVERLARAGAAAVVLDLILAEPDRTAPTRIAEALAGRADPATLAALTKGLPDPDHDLAAALGRAPSVVAFALAEEPGRMPRVAASFAEIGPARERLDRFAGAVPSLPEFEAAAAGNGSIGTAAGRDEVLRRLPAVALLGDALIPSLAVEALRVAQGAGTVTLRAVADGSGLDAVRVGAVILPVAPDGRFWLQFTPDTPARQVPAWRVLDPAVPDAELAAALRGRILLIGVTAAGFGDTVLTPLRDRIAGVTAHAEALEQILLGRQLTRPAWAMAAEIGLLLVLGLGLIASWRRLPAIISGGVVVLIAAALAAGAFLAYRQAGLLLDPTLPALGLLLTHGVVAATAQWRVERDRRTIRAAFARYLAPALVARLAEHPERLRLGGEWREMSFVFTDIAGFTSLSETVPPDRLVATLNAYFDGLCGCVLDAGGTIDKMVGDALHAMFGAPVDQPDHAERAVACALAIHRFATGFAAARRAEGMPFGETRIGVTTGSAVVGNFGSRHHFDYTAYSEAVNLAARLEHANKALGTPLCISAAAARACPGRSFRPVGRLLLRGVGTPVEAMMPDELCPAPAGAYAAAYAAVRRGEAGASALFAVLAAEHPEDPLARLHARRLAEGAKDDLIAID
ncbi:CHASE2 domain-containing protein [Inquilinus sp. Marseille-Q2685]|uniref:CHASE2 domain-containing protein n=1 Tax=Inquilinus sp. Marseille-Q2685 TaxID=2866581 RepID=UPI001CE3DEC8|nr:adenylate/guanylate cyclase domain-containing protein [Inquilinus sp. Marseille-Q2685]